MRCLVLALGVVFLRLYFFAEKIRFLTNKSISRSASVRVALTWDFASAITPSTIGGAPVATYAMTREGVDLGRSSAVVLYRSEEHTSELQSRGHLVCRLL